MDTKNPSNGTSLKCKNSTSFLTTYFRHQSWPLPDSIIYYITKNPSTPKCYQKMIQSCKYFFIKNPILIVHCICLIYYDNQWKPVCFGQSVDLKKSTTKKLWITEKIDIRNLFNNDQFFTSFAVKKIYQNNIKKLVIVNQVITFDDFKFFASKCEIVWLNTTFVMDVNGSALALEKVFEMLPKIREFCYSMNNTQNNIITSKTAKELIRIPHFSNLHKFAWDYIPETLDIECFYDYIKKNEKTKFDLDFCDSISEAFKNRLQTIVNEILALENRKFKVPYIRFSGIDETSYSNLWELQR